MGNAPARPRARCCPVRSAIWPGRPGAEPRRGWRGPRSRSGRGARQRPQLPLEESKNFLNALFDFGFTSFVTPKVVKVLYLLIVIVVGLSALAFAVTMLATNLALGLVVLLIGAPLYFLVVTALYRITLEFFMVIFRMAEDIRALRERGEIR